MNKAATHQWINTALLVICAIALIALWRTQTKGLGVQCLEPQEIAQQYFNIEEPGFCVAVAPAHLDRD